jgi:U3 small nucleolar RNA-associated protein 10
VYPSLEQSTNTSPGLTLAFFGRSAFPKPGLAQHYGHITFMGTSVLRQDNAYSFQVIVKTLKSVIPTLIEASMETAVEPVVTTVIHVFADALPEVPEHRRIPVFEKLLTTLDPEIYLWLAPTLILSNMATQGPRLGRGLVKDDGKDRVAPDVEFSLNVCHLYKPQVQLNASIRMIEYLQSLPF